MYWVGVFTAGMTAFYVFRALFLCFFGEYRGSRDQVGRAHGHDDHGHGGIHESPPSMWIPLAILAVLSLGGGYHQHSRNSWSRCSMSRRKAPEPWLMYVSVAVRTGRHRCSRICSTWSRPRFRNRSREAFSGPYRWIYNKYFVDEFYDSTVVEPVVDGSRALLWRVADVRIDRRRRQRSRQDRARHRQHAEARAIRLYPQLRGLGGGRVRSWSSPVWA